MSRRNVSYVKPSEPAFLKRLKERVGFKEGPTIETKREELPVEENDEDAQDERPVVVVLKPGDLTEEEVNEYLNTLKDEAEPKDEKITFKKPEKREAPDAGNVVASTKKLRVQDTKSSKKTGSESKKVKNKCLLSFNEEEHDDDE